MEEKPIKVSMSSLMASCLQRMLVDEIDNQEKWKKEDNNLGLDNNKFRDEVIKECETLQTQLEAQGIHKHIKCY